MRYMREENWEEFHRRFPRAEAFLIHCELENEKAHLTDLVCKGIANTWEANRLKELIACLDLTPSWKETTP